MAINAGVRIDRSRRDCEGSLGWFHWEINHFASLCFTLVSPYIVSYFVGHPCHPKEAGWAQAGADGAQGRVVNSLTGLARQKSGQYQEPVSSASLCRARLFTRLDVIPDDLTSFLSATEIAERP